MVVLLIAGHNLIGVFIIYRIRNGTMKNILLDEFIEFLKKYEIDYNERFLFKFWDDV